VLLRPPFEKPTLANADYYALSLYVLKQVPQVGTRDELHDDVEQRALLTKIVNLDDVGVVEPDCGAGFLEETFPEVRLAGEVACIAWMVTLRCKVTSRAWNTAPMPPSPSRLTVL
jgi:hypothetical protein